MINNVTLITGDYEFLNTRNLADQLHVSFKIGNKNALNNLSLSALYSAPLFSAGQVDFSVYIGSNGSDSEFKELINQLINQQNLLLQYIFHPSYLILSRKPVFCFNANDRNSPDLKKLIKVLTTLVEMQGYDALEVIYFENNISSTSHFCFAEDENLSKLQNDYFLLLSSHYYCSKYIGVQSKNINEVISNLKFAEDHLQKENDNLFKLLKQYRDLVLSNELLSERYRIVKSELENQKTYLKILRDQDEALKINDFYYYEYEILPLWYKKFGQILKVFLGKRNFQSLFDNNIKKYKN